MNRPPFLVSWANKPNKYHDQLFKLTTMGFPAFHIDSELDKIQKDMIPDTSSLEAEQVHIMPHMLKYLKCGEGLLENNCDEEHKYSKQCPKRFGKGGWHPGL